MDSDDHLTENAVNIMNIDINSIKDDCSGIVYPIDLKGSDKEKEWKQIDGKKVDIMDLKAIYGIPEAAILMRKSDIESLPFPQIKGEKFIPEGWLYQKLIAKGKFWAHNASFYIYKNVMDALELEHLEEEKLAAAIQQGAGKKAIEVVRAERSVQMKSVLAELNMEQFRRVPLYESYMANEITEEQYHAELMDYEEAHRKLNEQLTAIMEDTLVWERALSLRNPWIQQMAQYKAPEELDRSFVKKYIEQVTVTLLGDGQAEIGLTMKTYEWKHILGRIEMEETDDGTKE